MATISSEVLKDFLTTDEAAAALDITRTMAGSLCRRGKLPGAIQVGGTRGPWLIPRAAITARKRKKTAGKLDPGGRPSHKS